MTDDFEPSGDPVSDGMPYLPPSVPTLPPTLSAPSGSSAAQEIATAFDVPFLPSVKPVDPAPSLTPPTFDAKAMVASQKHVVANPVYGAIPKATPESLAAAQALRDDARRKRKRNKALGWTVAVVMLGGVGAAGWFAYQTYQDDQDQLAADKAARAAAGDSSAGIAPGALTPLGNQEQVIDALDDINSGGAAASAGGLLGAVDQAQDAVNDINGTSGANDAEASTSLTFADLLPEPVIRLGTRLDDVDGYERYVVEARKFAADDAAGYARFLAIVQAQSQFDPASADAKVVPQVQADEIGFAVLHDGDRIVRALIVSSDPAVHVDYAPG